MADEAAAEVVEASKAIFDLSLKTGAFGGCTVAIKIDNVWLAGALALGSLSLGAFYIYRRYPSQNAVRNALEGNEGGEVDPEVRAIAEGSIFVKLFCHTERSLLSFVDDLEAKRVNLRLEEEFLKIGYVGKLEVTIKNFDEVYEKVNQIRRRRQAKEFYERAVIISRKGGDRRVEGHTCARLGTVFEILGDRLKATEYLHKALVIARETGDKTAEATANGQLGIVSQALGDFSKAVEYLEKVLEITREIDDRHGEALAYRNLGSVFHSIGEYVKAEEWLRKALQALAEIDDRKGEASAYGSLGSVFQSVGKYKNAEEYLQKALKISVEIGDKECESAAYGSLGSVFQSFGKYDKAAEFLKKSLKMSIEIGDRKGEAAAYGNLGSVFQSVGKYQTAEEYIQKALKKSVEIGDRKGEAAAYGNIGSVFQSAGKYGKAEEYLHKALKISIEIGDRKGESAAYGSLGSVCQSVGEYVKAEEYLQKALPVFIEIGDRKGEAAAYGNLGSVYQSVGKYDKAEEYLQKALKKSIDIGDRKCESAAYGNLGSVFQSVGEYVKAEGYLQKALLVSIEIGDRKGEAVAYGNLGSVYQSTCCYHRAEKYLQKALQISIEIGDRMGEGSALRNLGSVFECRDDYLKAQEYLQKALPLSIKIGDRKGEASCLTRLGTVFLSLRKYDKAEDYLERALGIAKEIGDRDGEASVYGNLGTVFHAVGDYVAAKRYNQTALSVSTEIGDREKESRCLFNLSWLTFLSGKIQKASLYLRNCISKLEDFRVLLRGNDQMKMSFFDERALYYSILSALLCAAENPDEALYTLELGRAGALTDLMSDLYGVKETQITANPQSWVGIEKIMTKEKNSTCLYLSYSPRRLFLWVLKPNEVIFFREIEVNISGSYEIELARVIQPQLSSPQIEYPTSFRLIEEDEDDKEEEEITIWSLEKLYKLLIEPVVDLLEESEIIIVPDRALHQVPFAALKDESGKYLSETFKIRVVPSLTILKLIQDSPADYHSQSGALIVGDPEIYNVFYEGNLLRLSPLPVARKEAQIIGQLLGVQPLLGKLATKQAVLENMHSASLIHFAVHSDAKLRVLALAPPHSFFNIFEEQDYMLTMTEISQVRVRAKLVVLSCCHSGRFISEEVTEFARAFLGSGARSVLAAVSPIEDESTMQLMRHFYQHLALGESASESLHQAMKWMRRNGFCESQWAPFMLIGDNVTFAFGK